jgi:hypothetical protein
MHTLNDTFKPETTHLIQVNPDRLIEIGHKIKELSMNQAFPGDSVVVEFTDRITFVYTPEKEFTKPVHTYGGETRLPLWEPASGSLSS